MDDDDDDYQDYDDDEVGNEASDAGAPAATSTACPTSSAECASGLGGGAVKTSADACYDTDVEMERSRSSKRLKIDEEQARSNQQ